MAISLKSDGTVGWETYKVVVFAWVASRNAWLEVGATIRSFEDGNSDPATTTLHGINISDENEIMTVKLSDTGDRLFVSVAGYGFAPNYVQMFNLREMKDPMD